MTTRWLIVNADGFGFTEGVNRGILETMACGVVQSTSVLTNFPSVEQLPLLHDHYPNVSVGVHLNLSVGRPVLAPKAIPSLIGPDGLFRRDVVPAMMKGQVRRVDMLRELEAQVMRVIELGVQPTHVDGHQNKHLFPPFFRAALDVARSHGIACMRTHRRYLFAQDGRSLRSLVHYYAGHPKQIATHLAARVLTRWARGSGLMLADRLITPGYIGSDHKSSLQTWCRVLEQLPAGTSEIYCHPGYPDDELRRYAKYVDERRLEIDVLCDSRLKSIAQEQGIEFISFHQLIG